MDIHQIASKTFQQTSNTRDYKQLYEQSKKNVALFIATVDKEISTLLSKHSQQLHALRSENEELKSLLNIQNKSIMISNKSNLPISSRQNSRQHRPCRTVEKFQNNQNTKDFYECGLSQISLAQSKSIFSDNKKSTIITYVLGEKSQNLTDRSTFDNKTSSKNRFPMFKSNSNLNQKNSSSIFKLNQENEFDQKKELTFIKQKMSNTRKHKRNVSLMQNIKDKQNVKDMLKNIRQRINTPEYCLQLMNQQFQKKREITIAPEMFKRNN